MAGTEVRLERASLYLVFLLLLPLSLEALLLSEKPGLVPLDEASWVVDLNQVV